MKTRTFSLVLLLAVIPFVSCQKDNPEENENLVEIDDASSFIGHFVSLDENGQVALYLSGYLLNEADPTEISYTQLPTIYQDMVNRSHNMKNTGVNDVDWVFMEEQLDRVRSFRDATY